MPWDREIDRAREAVLAESYQAVIEQQRRLIDSYAEREQVLLDALRKLGVDTMLS